MTLAFFCLGALSLLGELDNSVTDENKHDWIEWVYAQQVLPTGQEPDANEALCGFRGSSWSGRKFDPNAVSLILEKSKRKERCTDNFIHRQLVNSNIMIQVILPTLIPHY